ncbi:hypothetical protein ACTXT7_004818 [Hymenolepis weldensis]
MEETIIASLSLEKDVCRIPAESIRNIFLTAVEVEHASAEDLFKKYFGKRTINHIRAPRITTIQRPDRAICRHGQNGPTVFPVGDLEFARDFRIGHSLTVGNVAIYEIQVSEAIWIRHKNEIRSSIAPASIPLYLLLDTLKIPANKLDTACERTPEQKTH